MRKKQKHKIVSLLLALSMIVSMMPMTTSAVYATETGVSAEEISTDTPEDSMEEGAEAIIPTEEETAESSDEESSDEESTDQEIDENDPVLDESEVEAENAVPKSDPFQNNYASFLRHYKELEQYAAEYAELTAGQEDSKDATELAINFVRTAKEEYNSGNWESFCGPEIIDFTSYVDEQDKKYGTDAMGLKQASKFDLPNGETSDILHMFAVMNMTYTMAKKSMNEQAATSYADLGGWAGDLCDLLYHAVRDGESLSLEQEAMVRYIYNNLLGYSKGGISSVFGKDDVYADLDAFYLLKEQGKKGTSIGSIMESYFTVDQKNYDRVQYFLENRLGGASTQESIRTAVEDIYSNSFLIKTLESSRELRSYDAARKASCYAFADYLYGVVSVPECEFEEINLNKGQSLSQSTLRGTAFYFGEAVEGNFSWKNSATIPEESAMQEAVFVPADTFRYSEMTVKVPVLVDGVQITPEEPENPDPEEPEEPEEPETPVEKPIYEVFSSKSSTLAPGVTQTTKYANTIDNKQMVYYIATADVNREDLTLYANYNNNDGSVWGMQTVKDQMNAAKAKHSDPSDAEHYIENYMPVVGINGDYFAMTSTGAPHGALVMEGVEYHPITDNSFFGILKDGTPIIGGRTEWNQYHTQLQEAVGAVVRIVRDGEVTNTGDSTTGRAGFSAVGYTADGQIVFLTVDGRQEPFSCGANMVALGQIMKEAGCVEAVSLDGGGSTTFCAKREGEDEISTINRPSDGYDRRVGSTLMIVSTARNSNEFDHANIKAEYDYLSVGTDEYLTVAGVSVSGNAAEIPEGSYWNVVNSTIGTITEDGLFTAKKVGDTEVQLVAGDEILGALTIHVVRPNGITFAQEEVAAIFGEDTVMPVIATYNGNPVKLALDTDLLMFEADNAAVGDFHGIVFTANSEEYGCRTCKVTVYLWDDFDIYAEALIRCYNSGEAVFDFENATNGDRSFAWKREVTNSEIEDENIYHIINPGEKMDISYAFALDMNYLAIPENIKEALPELAAFLGADISEVSAWQLLVALADRVSPSTSVTITVDVDKNLDLDVSEMVWNCEYFTLTDIDFNENTHKLTLICYWNKQDGPIDVNRANPICIISGIKATVKDDAAWTTDNQLRLNMSGSVVYNARLRSSQAYNLASGEIGQEYGLSPYDNRENLEGDMGAQFSATHVEFTDTFYLDRSALNGWVTNKDGDMAYYRDNEMLKGIQYLPEPNGKDEYYYSFDDNGICEGKYTGFIQIDKKWYYPVNGTPAKGWREIDGAYYYFKSTTGQAVSGTKEISGITYEFESNGKLKSGVWVQKEEGMRYYYGPSYYNLNP